MIAVDTNIISAFLRGETVNMPESELYIPFVVRIELESGIAAGNNPRKNSQLLESFFQSDKVTTSPGLSPGISKYYSQIYIYLRAEGTPVSPNDLWIAAECMQLSLPLYTRDTDFKNVPQILLV